MMTAFFPAPVAATAMMTGSLGAASRCADLTAPAHVVFACFLKEFGFNPWSISPLAWARFCEPLAMVWSHSASALGPLASLGFSVRAPNANLPREV